MSHANKLAQLAYSKRAHSEWSLLQKWEADVEKLSVQERKELLAKLKVRCCLCNVPYCDAMMSVICSMPGMQHKVALHDVKHLTARLPAWLVCSACKVCLAAATVATLPTHWQMSMSVTVPTYHCAILLLISNINQIAADIQAFVTSEFCLSIMPTGGTAGGVGQTGARQTKG